MSEEIKEIPQEEQKKKGPGKALGCFLFLLLLIGGGYAFYELAGKNMYAEWEKKQKVGNYIQSARSFIEDRNFTYAEGTLEDIKELTPEHAELEELEEQLVKAKLINHSEQELAASLQSKDWARVKTAIEDLKDRQRDHPQIQIAKDEMKVGMHQDRLIELQDKLTKAQKSNNLQTQIEVTKDLIKHDPENPIASRWQEINQRAKDEISESEKKAKVIYEQALLVDKGVYSTELFNLAQKAKLLSTKPVYHDFFEKVSKYPRIIRYPNEYSNLQDAIDTARPIDTIQIAEGSFHAPVKIDKEVYLLGVSEKSTLHATGKNSPVIHVTKNGKLTAKNILIKHVDEGESDTAYSAIVVEGEANLESCVVFQSVGHGIHVLNEGKLVAKSVRVEANRWSGVVATGSRSLAALTDCVVTRNGHNGIDAWDTGRIEFYNCFSDANSYSGAVATMRGTLKITNSTITNNKHTGLYLTQGGNADMRSSELTGNSLAGGYGSESGTVTLQEVKVIRNSVAGIVLTKNTSWQGVDELSFTDNDGQKVWKDAEFRIEEILKSLKPEEKTEESTTEGDEEAPEETSSTEGPTPKEGTPPKAIIVEEPE